MQNRKAYKYRFKTSSSDDSLFSRFSGCCRFVWNKALALQKERLAAGNRKSQELFVCENCDHTANADVNAVINIERAGHARLACQVNGAIMPSATGTSRIAA